MTKLTDDSKPTSVYIAYDKDGQIIYVGITHELPRRLDRHSVDSPWWPQSRRIDVEHYSSRPRARAREKLLIMAFSPPFNVEGKTHPTEIHVGSGNGSIARAPRQKVRLNHR